jgi:hypothetical protein
MRRTRGRNNTQFTIAIGSFQSAALMLAWVFTLKPGFLNEESELPVSA